MSEVKVDTISERTTDAGVTVEGVKIEDGVATFQTAAGSPLVFEGATANAYETTFAITDPTADRTITFPDASFTVPSSGFDSIALLSTQTASTSASINFDDTLITSDYKTYEFKYMNVVGSADGVQLQMKFSDDNGSNFDSNHTGGFLNSYTSSSSAGVTYDASMDSIGADHHMLGTDQSWDAGDSMGGRVTIQNPSSTSFITTYQGEASYITHHATIYNYTTYIGGLWDSLAAVNYVRFQMASGNLVTGTFQLWGYK